jgi:quercetin dioxygenase-like cupin family protein
MAKPGDVIENPQSGEKVIFRTTTEESGGKLLAFDFYFKKGGRQPASHRHMKQESRFKVISGKLGGRLNRSDIKIYEPGEQLIVPMGTPHQVWNAGDDEVHAFVEFEPAGHFEAFLETAFALIRDGKMDGDRRVPKPFLHACLLSKENELYLSALPVSLQKAGFAVFAPLAKRRGYSDRYPTPA